MKYFILVAFFLVGFSSLEDDIITILKSKSQNYFNLYKLTKLELLFSQPSSAAGDTIKFQIAYLNTQTLKPVSGTNIVHIYLFDQFGKKRLTRWVEITNGYSSNEFVIPTNFPSGNYKLVAFTDWMRNFDQSLYFQHDFTVVGKLLIAPVAPNDTLIFFPESGSLLVNTKNNLAIRYTGHSTRTDVTISDGERDLGSFTCTKDSVHLFRFTPKANATYFAEIKNVNGRKRFPLPSAKASGVLVQVDYTESQIEINTEYVGISESGSEDLYVALFNSNGLLSQTRLNFDTNRKRKILLPSSLPIGIIQLVVFDKEFNLLASRVIHNGEPRTKKVILANLQSNYATRDEVKLSFKIDDKNGSRAPSFFTCRVVKDSLFGKAETRGMDYLTFSSDISNTFLLKQYRVTQRTINNYLITQTCPWFNWKKIFKDDQRPALVKPQQDLVLRGTATFTKSGKRVPDSTYVILFFEKRLHGYETYTDANGNFSFRVVFAPKYPDRLFYTATIKGEDADDISLQINDPDSSLSFSAIPWKAKTNSIDQYGAYSAQVQVIQNSYSFFLNPSSSNYIVEDRNKEIEEKLNGAGLIFDLNDYLLMPTMEEVVKEIINFVAVRTINGRKAVMVFTAGKLTSFQTGPLFVIDGMMTKDPAYFFSLKPADVISIRVVNDSKKLFPLGSLGANGVLIVKTKLGRNALKETHMTDFGGFLPKTRNSFFGYSRPDVPDLRACLLWTSKVYSGKDDNSLIFKTSDDIGRFNIQILGIAEDGTPFYSEYPFDVKINSN